MFRIGISHINSPQERFFAPGAEFLLVCILLMTILPVTTFDLLHGCLHAAPNDILINHDAASDEATQPLSGHGFNGAEDSTSLRQILDKAVKLRESGKHKALLLRKLDWDRSEKYFGRILESDSTFDDVVFQYAVLLRYRERYEDAIDLVYRQIAIKPNLVEPRVEIFRFFRHLINARKYKQALSWLKKRSSQSEANYAMGELYRKQGKYKLAAETFQKLLSDDQILSKIPVYSSFCRLCIATDQPRLVSAYYWKSIAEIRNYVDATLVFEDLKYIASDDELRKFLSQQTVSGLQSFVSDFWSRRNPIPAARVNPRIVEHFNRIVYAEKYYEYYGFRTAFTNPDRLGYFKFNKIYALNREFNDKGVIYIRHGKPDDRVVSFGDEVPSNESWLYFETNHSPRMIFHFTLFNTPNFWRVTPIIEDPVMLEDRLGWDEIYFRMLNSQNVEQLSIRQEMALKNQKSLLDGLNRDRHTWSKDTRPLEMSFYTASFKGDSVDTIFEIYQGFDIPGSAKARSGEIVDLENGYTIQHYDLTLVDSLLRRNHYNDQVDDYSDTFRSSVDPDSYVVSLYAHIFESDYIGGYKFRIIIPDYASNDSLNISDLQLAFDISTSISDYYDEKQGIYIYPNPKLAFERETPVYVYFEIYNLHIDEDGNTQFLIEYNLTLLKADESFFSSILNVFGKDPKTSITTSIQREGETERSNEYIALDVSNMAKGFYKLSVTVRDRNNASSVAKERVIKIY
ncbi:GWxTD domain-containing protein [candidate division KSB1 bacterium]|nr:GWxTD domain-containing protein [candidate division KSB1 bacterium]